MSTIIKTYKSMHEYQKKGVVDINGRSHTASRYNNRINNHCSTFNNKTLYKKVYTENNFAMYKRKRVFLPSTIATKHSSSSFRINFIDTKLTSVVLNSCFNKINSEYFISAITAVTRLENDNTSISNGGIEENSSQCEKSQYKTQSKSNSNIEHSVGKLELKLDTMSVSQPSSYYSKTESSSISTLKESSFEQGSHRHDGDEYIIFKSDSNNNKMVHQHFVANQTGKHIDTEDKGESNNRVTTSRVISNKINSKNDNNDNNNDENNNDNSKRNSNYNNNDNNNDNNNTNCNGDYDHSVKHIKNRVSTYHSRSSGYHGNYHGNKNNKTLKTKYDVKDFKLKKTLGTGTFGRVFLTVHVKSKKIYAMKVMKLSTIIKLNQIEHVNNEKNILETSKHPFVVESYWFCLDRSKLYILFEYVPGGELFTYLKNKGRFTSNETLFYVAEIIVVFEFLHNKSIVYRDLKPENLLVGIDGHIKFTDFGFSKTLHNNTTYTLCGTPEYLSPECIQGKGYDYSCDWWALGIITYEMLVGDPPFVDMHPFSLYQKILHGEVHYPSHLKHTVQKDFIAKLLKVDRSKRLGKGQFGAKEVKRQPWLKSVDWEQAKLKKLQPPFVPTISSKDDTRNFDEFEETWDTDTVDNISQVDLHKFKDWQS